MPKSSIPSKFARRPYVAEALDKCFGSQTSRFAPQRRNTQPGPGQYHAENRIDRTRVSESTRGVGSFASKSNRFRAISNSKQMIPAPGAYTDPNFSKKLIAPIRGASDAVFTSKTKKLSWMRIRNTPAPGAYDVRKPLKTVTGQSSTFMSKTDRSSYLKDFVRDSPAPGTYDPTRVVGKPANKHSASFTSKQVRIPRHIDRNPGPGQYNSYTSFVEKKSPPKNSKLHVRNSVYANDNLDRWGKPYNSKVKRGPAVPGPGAYTREYKPQSKKPVSSSWALSNVGRSDSRSGFSMTAPGPAYYTRERKFHADSKFHLNKSGRWM